MANNLKKYDANQVLRSVFDVERNTLRVSVIDGSTGDGSGFEVIITHTDDSIRLGDGSNFITSTTIGPKVGLDVNVINDISITPNDNVNGYIEYNEITSVASGIETTIVSYTAMIGKKTYLQKIEVSGDNIAKYRVKLNGVEIDMKRTYFSGGLNTNFIYDGNNNPGLEVNTGDIISVTTIHQRPDVSDFNGKIVYLEV